MTPKSWLGSALILALSATSSAQSNTPTSNATPTPTQNVTELCLQQGPIVEHNGEIVFCIIPIDNPRLRARLRNFSVDQFLNITDSDLLQQFRELGHSSSDQCPRDPETLFPRVNTETLQLSDLYYSKCNLPLTKRSRKDYRNNAEPTFTPIPSSTKEVVVWKRAEPPAALAPVSQAAQNLANDRAFWDCVFRLALGTIIYIVAISLASKHVGQNWPAAITATGVIQDNLVRLILSFIYPPTVNLDTRRILLGRYVLQTLIGMGAGLFPLLKTVFAKLNSPFWLVCGAFPTILLPIAELLLTERVKLFLRRLSITQRVQDSYRSIGSGQAPGFEDAERQYGDRLYKSAEVGDLRGVIVAVTKAGSKNIHGGDLRVSALQIAADKGHYDVVEVLLADDQNFHDIENKYRKAFENAYFECKSYYIVRRVLMETVNVNEGGRLGTAIHAACRSGNTEIVKLLISEDGGATESLIIPQDGMLPLHLACKFNRTSITPAIIDSYASVAFRTHLDRNLIDVAGREGTGLHIACKEGYSELVHMLLDAGASLTVSHEGMLPLHVACKYAYGHYIEAYINPIDVEASSRNRLEIVKTLLQGGADVTARAGKRPALAGESRRYRKSETIFGATALHFAAMKGIPKKVTKLLLDYGAEVNAQTEGLQTPLHWAVYKLSDSFMWQSTGVVEVLLRYYADVSLVDADGRTVLEMALNRLEGDIVLKLFEYRFEFLHRTHEDSRALVLYSGSNRGLEEEMVEWLLERGANPNAADSYGSALQQACKLGSYRTVSHLLEYDAQVNAPPGLYGTALQAACQPTNDRFNLNRINFGDPRLEIVKILLERGADSNIEGGLSVAIDHAKQMGHKSILELLVSEQARRDRRVDPSDERKIDINGPRRRQRSRTNRRPLLPSAEDDIEAGSRISFHTPRTEDSRTDSDSSFHTPELSKDGEELRLDIPLERPFSKTPIEEQEITPVEV
ncbi:MAG: hypothetical protein M1831_000281 [Alyxoria varia]|nr:MAG: hypothetical protein M1831_000281 [Alyxoria varia]